MNVLFIFTADITLVEAIDHNRVGRCLYDVHDLKPGSSYRFRVVAYNRYGKGPPSLPSCMLALINLVYSSIRWNYLKALN